MNREQVMRGAEQPNQSPKGQSFTPAAGSYPCNSAHRYEAGNNGLQPGTQAASLVPSGTAGEGG